MKRDLAEAVALGVCTFNYDNSDGEKPPQPSDPCEEICPYCRQQAEFLLKIIAAFDMEKDHHGADQQQPAEGLHRAN
jgi:hypothetical protein